MEQAKVGEGPKILVIGLSASGAAGLPASLIRRIAEADLLVGGQRHLGYFADFAGETLLITANIEAVAARLQQALTAGEQAVVLASGDPLCFGIGASLRRHLPGEVLEIIPSPSAFQLAFAALAEPWAEAALLSAHARPLAEVVAKASTATKAAILTDNVHTPAAVAQALLKANFAPASPVAICENLGAPTQRIIRTSLADVEKESYARLNVFVIWNKPDQPTFQPSNLPALQSSFPPGLPDDAFSTSAGQISKREVRLLSLAELALAAGEVLWDIGAGSGAVGIEAARSQPIAQVYAIEKRAELCRHLQENLARFPAANYQWRQGLAPADVADWPDPQAVFIGGSGGQLADLIETVQRRLQPGGRLVINLATLENLQTGRTLLPSAQIVQAQFSRGVPILEMLRFEALNPIFIVTWKKSGERDL